MSNQCCSKDGEGGKDEGGGGGSRSKTSCMWRVVRDKVVCERWCATKKMMYVPKMVCERSCVCESCEWKVVCDRAVWERWCVAKVHCWIRKCKPAQNMNWVQARHWHAASLRTFFFAPALQCHLLGIRFLPTVGQNRNGSIHGRSGWPRPRHVQKNAQLQKNN